MTIMEMRNLLNTVEEITKHPETILKNFPDTGARFLYSIDFNDMPMCIFIKKELEHLPPFSECSINDEYWKGSFSFSVKISSLDYNCLHKQPETIARLFPRKREFVIVHNAEEYYQKEMNQPITFQPSPVSEREKRFRDLSFKGRMKCVEEEWRKKEALWAKISSINYWMIYVPFHKRKCLQALKNIKMDRKNADKRSYDMYQEALSRKKYYRRFAPDYLANMKKKQNEIREYLLTIGYKQVMNPD